MNDDRIQQALDGNVALEMLTASELAAYRRLRDAIDAALEPLERTAEIDVSAAVMKRIRLAPRQRPLARASRWLWDPRPVAFRLRPAVALAAAAMLALVVAIGRQRSVVESGDRMARAAMVVEFRLSAPGARDVALVGDFNSWKPAHRLRQTAPGVWAVSVPLEPGVYDYGFVVDGSSVRLDPLAPRVADGFGGESSRVTVMSAVRS
jgi:hypothetical protein